MDLHGAAAKFCQFFEFQFFGKFYQPRSVSIFCTFCIKITTPRCARPQTCLTTDFLPKRTNQYAYLYMQGNKEDRKMNNNNYPFPINQIPGYNQLQQIQQMFPQPQGSVYAINSPLDIGNVPTGSTGLSVAICFAENLMYIKSFQNG